LKFFLRVPTLLSLDSLRRFRNTFVGFRPALAGQGGSLAGTLALSAVIVFLELLRPWPIKFLFDRVLVVEGTAGGGPFEGWSPQALVPVLCASVVAIAFGIGTIRVRQSVLVARIGRKVSTRIRKRVFEHIHRLDFPFHLSSRTGDLLHRLMGDVNMVKELLFSTWAGLFERALLFTGTAAVMLFLAPGLTGLALLPLPFLFVGLRRSSRELTTVTKKQRRKEGNLASFAAETLRQIRVVKAYAGEDRATRQFTRQTRSSERAGMKAAKIAAGMGRTAEIMTGIGLAIVLYIGARRVLAGALTPGELIVLISYTRSLYKPVRKLPQEGVRLSKATACAGRILEVLRLPPEPASEGLPAPPFRGEIRVENVTKSYPTGVQALRGLDVEIPAGSLAVVSGPNGAGKSTLLSMLLRLVDPDGGRITIDGMSIQEFALDSYRNRLAYVPQEILLFGGTVTDNILYGNPDASESSVQEAARVALVADFIEEMPDRYETLLGENGASVSGGEGRRLMLARAAVRDASILLLDEPLEGLDPAARATVAKAIRGIAAGRTTLVVSHGPAAELEPDLHLRLRGGRLVDGDPRRPLGATS
jgi:ATP-binding cassette subfamily B protein